MWKASAAAALIYGLISIAGGTMGYLNKGSVPSIVGGGIGGLLLLLCSIAIYFTGGNRWALIGAIVVSLLLAGRFIGSTISKRNNLSEFFGSLLGQVAIVMIVAGILVIVISGLALTKGSD